MDGRLTIFYDDTLGRPNISRCISRKLRNTSYTDMGWFRGHWFASGEGTRYERVSGKTENLDFPLSELSMNEHMNQDIGGRGLHTEILLSVTKFETFERPLVIQRV